MIRLYLSVFSALFILVVPKESVGQYGNFTDLSGVTIQVGKLGSVTKKLGIDETAIKNHALVLLRSKLPRLLVKDSADSTVYIHVDVGEVTTGREAIGYYGFVTVSVSRVVTIMKTGKVTEADLFSGTQRLRGPLSHTSDGVRGVIDNLLTSFAAAWSKDNPSK